MVPTVNIGAIRAGHPTQPVLTPAACRLFLDVRLPPGATPLTAQAELRELLDKCGLDGQVDVYLFRRGYVAEGAEPVVDADTSGFYGPMTRFLHAAIKEVTREAAVHGS